MGMLKNFEMAKEDEEAQEKFKKARKLKRQVCQYLLIQGVYQYRIMFDNANINMKIYKSIFGLRRKSLEK